MPLQATSGAASYDGFGGGVAAVPTYIEDVFSTYLYTGNGSTQTITNGIDLAGKGGLVWIKGRNLGTQGPIYTTDIGVSKAIAPANNLSLQSFPGNGVTAFNANGFAVAGNIWNENDNGITEVSWTFRKQPKFFDVVTYTGTGSARTIAHSLGSTPGCIFVKRTDLAGDWYVYHSGYGGTGYYLLNSTAAPSSDSTIWNDTNPTSTVFSVGTGNTNVNGGTYVAFLFAHNAGGFGLTGTDNVISCGTFSTNASGVRVQSLGYEPQWILIKRASGGTGNWYMFDTMRGWSMSNDALLNANLSDSEASSLSYGNPTATGFETANLNGSTTFIYIAIRRGPMKVPTSGTSVFSPVARAGTSATANVTAGFAPDAVFVRARSSAAMNVLDKLRGADNVLQTSNTGIEEPYAGTVTAFGNTTFTVGTNNLSNGALNYINYPLQRAPNFFDEVCYTGTGAAMTINHNLGVTPEMAIIKNRSSGTTDWGVWHQSISPASGLLFLNNTSPRSTGFIGTRTATTFAFSTGNAITSASGNNYVAYFFATLAGVSKVGTYTGTGTTLQIDCGFTAGARFVLIRRTDSVLTGNWYVWDTARGITSGNDPYALMNGTGAEVTNTDYIDPYSAGFEISSTAPAEINGSGNSFIFLAIA